jgi:ABC-type dipeptide/oligopeptide/nickel transport system ATPase component
VTEIRISIPGFRDLDGTSSVVILGPNGSGKTQLAQKIAQQNKVSAISAQRRTWIDDNLPVQEEQQLRSNIRSQIDQWRSSAWQPTQEINFILSDLIREHTNILTERNEQALASDTPFRPVNDTKLILLQTLWGRLFPKRKLEIGGFFPKVKRLDVTGSPATYHLRQMSDGERTVLYMAARLMTADHPIILVDEPELHMHSRLAVQFWDEAEKLRDDCRFVYVTHDLNFALSRRDATVVVARPGEKAEAILVDELPSSIAADVLGAATLPFYSRRIFLYEGEAGRGFASGFFSAWFDDDATFAVPCGDRDSVCAAVSGLHKVGVTAAEIVGLIDRDFYPESVLSNTTAGVRVLPLHEIESVLCCRAAVSCIAEHLGKDPSSAWEEYLTHIRGDFRGRTLHNVVARRVRARVGDLLDGAFVSSQIGVSLEDTVANHRQRMESLDLPAKTAAMFAEESSRVESALREGGGEMLAILPGKHLLSILTGTLGFANQTELVSLVVHALDRRRLKSGDPLLSLGDRLEASLSAYLPPRKTP